MKTIKWILVFISILAIVVVAGVAILSLTDYKPEAHEQIYSSYEKLDSDTESLSVLTWNIGYGGLGRNMDFFYDGGRRVKDNQENTKKNIKGIGQFLMESDSIDFLMLQEVDVYSDRTYYINQVDELSKAVSEYNVFFAKNYDAFYIPFPIREPIGKIVAGLVTYSRYVPLDASRYSFPGNFKWPKKLFFMDRCFLMMSYKIGDKMLHLINTHNSAYDVDGSLRRQQFAHLKEFASELYEAGDYVVIGGDWNLFPPEIQAKYDITSSNSNNFPEGWSSVYDDIHYTNRNIDMPYSAQNDTNMFDYFVLSPNVYLESIKTMDLDFEYSDHQPVYMSFTFTPPLEDTIAVDTLIADTLAIEENLEIQSLK